MAQEFIKSTATNTRAVILAGEGEDLRVLLLRRKFPPYDGMLSLPGGFIKSGEGSKEAIYRKVAREVGLDSLDKFSCIQLSSRVRGQDPRGEQLTDSYLFIAPSGYDCDSDDLEGEERPTWYFLDEVETLGFNHGAILCEAIGGLWGHMPTKFDMKLKLSLPTPYGPDKVKWFESVAFFGGSFNPWHEGHQACLDLCPNQNIVIIPDSNPWKVDHLSQSHRCFWHEFRSLADKFSNGPYAVFPGFFGSEKGNPTFDWVSLM